MHRLQGGELHKVPDRSRQRTAEINVEGKIPAMQTHVCHELPHVYFVSRIDFVAANMN
jgi:hypothetical protein